MKRFDLYGIGAGLVDLEISVTDDELELLNLEKGTMKLVDLAEQEKILKTFIKKNKKIDSYCGGSVCNSTTVAQQFGAKTFFSCKLANDAFGHTFSRELKKIGTSQCKHVLPNIGVTGTCLVMITEDAERTMITHLGVSEELSTSEIDMEACTDSKWVLFEGYLLTDEGRATLVKKIARVAKDNGVKIALTFSDSFVTVNHREELSSIFDIGVDHVFCNQTEALTFTGKNNLADAQNALVKYSNTCAITQGANGASVYTGRTWESFPGVEVVPINTNGAGDVFAGAFMYGMVRNLKVPTIAKFANAAAAELVQGFGPRLSRERCFSIRDTFLF